MIAIGNKNTMIQKNSSQIEYGLNELQSLMAKKILDVDEFIIFHMLS